MNADLLELDRTRIWHPYGPMPAAQAPLPVASAEGVRLTLADGRELVDGMASWWCAIHGYRHPVSDAARIAARVTGGSKNALYARALELAREAGSKPGKAR